MMSLLESAVVRGVAVLPALSSTRTLFADGLASDAGDCTDGSAQTSSSRKLGRNAPLKDGSVYEFRPTSPDVGPFTKVTVSIFKAATPTESTTIVGELEATKGRPAANSKSKPNFKVAIVTLREDRRRSRRSSGGRAVHAPTANKEKEHASSKGPKARVRQSLTRHRDINWASDAPCKREGRRVFLPWDDD